ncbi:hypothetical protein TIFTF001_016852 [Ficus carica]|uniref:Uncharacterized protein n=1 Tax=Ficus carica TaxID=3494 RepID=A0AA88D947_FICCA|nr:hypothetical protein TIFTF001_016852 [Ficus carica]
MKERVWRPYGRRSNEEEGRAGGVIGRIRERVRQRCCRWTGEGDSG